MNAYYKCYLNEIVETQGKLFDYVTYHIPQADSEDFIYKYMKSKTRSFIDRADAFVSNLDEDELFNYFCKVDGYKIKKGESLKGFMPNWIGQFYAFFQWKNNIPSNKLIEKLPLEFMKASYYGLHDLDLELAVKKVKDANVIGIGYGIE